MREQRNLIRDEERRREQKTGKITGRATPNLSGAYSGGTISMFHKAVERRENERAAREAAASGDAEGALALLDASSPNMSPSGHSRRRSGGKSPSPNKGEARIKATGTKWRRLVKAKKARTQSTIMAQPNG